MTNYEWLLKSNEELVKDILSQHIGKEKGIPSRCSKTGCDDCDFGCYPNTISGCVDATKKWLEEEHVPLYKKGDLVIDSNDQLAVIVNDNRYDEDIVLISHYVDNVIGIKEHASEIKKKVGHI